ncbi:hypothetical protein SLS53_005066 [Cytospora paraplurivora]|uniref:Amino acid transporter transmembrane domain-containing protein n=1 Tax=Cytospora paraplurivora TaxID=2898453 RepID=A0AAN9U752_9PEZI
MLGKRSSPREESPDEKNIPTRYDADVEATPNHPNHGWPQWFGGSRTTVGPRIGPVLKGTTVADVDSDDSASVILKRQKEAEQGAEIVYRSCSWQKIDSSLICWEFCLRHPEVRDVCDIGQMIFWNKKWAWWFTAVMFLLNNTFIQGLHVLVGAKYLNTMTSSDSIGCRTVSFSVLMFGICWLCSLPRTFNTLSKLGAASALFTFISVLLAMIFAGVEAHPAGYDLATLGKPLVTAVPVAGTTFVSGLSAFLNISYTFIGQITLPSFIAEMKDPREFPKALWAITIAEIIVFGLVGAIVYAYTGNQYMTAPAFGSLEPVFKKVAFSFMIPTLIFLGVLYASVSARFVFFRIFQDSHHKNSNTVKGWLVWIAILGVTWVLAFIISQVIPFFSDLLSLMSSLFDSFFGFIFWGVAYFRMRKVDGSLALIKTYGIWGYLEAALNIFIILIGLFFLGPGTYASVESIIIDFDPSSGDVFSCASNGL